MLNILSIGDEVMKYDHAGNLLGPYAVNRIEINVDVFGENGVATPNIPWDCVNTRDVVVDLSNGSWAWGTQLVEITEQ